MVNIVGYPSVSLSPILNKNEKVKQYIRKKIHKPIALRFWVKGGVIPLCMFGPFLLFVRFSQLCLSYFSNNYNKWYHKYNKYILPTLKYE